MILRPVFYRRIDALSAKPGDIVGIVELEGREEKVAVNVTVAEARYSPSRATVTLIGVNGRPMVVGATAQLAYLGTVAND